MMIFFAGLLTMIFFAASEASAAASMVVLSASEEIRPKRKGAGRMGKSPGKWKQGKSSAIRRAVAALVFLADGF
jgi:hypothetical protein